MEGTDISLIGRDEVRVRISDAGTQIFSDNFKERAQYDGTANSGSPGS